jgi:hypothetical protein
MPASTATNAASYTTQRDTIVRVMTVMLAEEY